MSSDTECKRFRDNAASRKGDAVTDTVTAPPVPHAHEEPGVRGTLVHGVHGVHYEQTVRPYR